MYYSVKKDKKYFLNIIYLYIIYSVLNQIKNSLICCFEITVEIKHI